MGKKKIELTFENHFSGRTVADFHLLVDQFQEAIAKCEEHADHDEKMKKMGERLQEAFDNFVREVQEAEFLYEKEHFTVYTKMDYIIYNAKNYLFRVTKHGIPRCSCEKGNRFVEWLKEWVE